MDHELGHGVYGIDDCHPLRLYRSSISDAAFAIFFPVPYALICKGPFSNKLIMR